MGVWVRGRRDAGVCELTPHHTNAASVIALLERPAVAPARVSDWHACPQGGASMAPKKSRRLAMPSRREW
jgi:hypothetical protein